MKLRTTLFAIIGIGTSAATPQAAEFHVATNGNDASSGTLTSPLRTIQRAAHLAQPGDVVTVHAGTYRERISPPRGGESDARRIVYQAAPGEKVELKGSEMIKNWVKVQGDVWKVTLPNSFFGRFNPYSDLIHGDWFNPKGREHHTGAVYLNGEWLAEAAKLDELLAPSGAASASLVPADGQYLLNVAWLRPGKGAGNAGRIPAAGFAARHGVEKAPCSEGGECIGWIEHGDWVRYERIDFGPRAELIEFRAASATDGGIIEIRLDTPDGELLGTCTVANTGDWQSWALFTAKTKPSSGVKPLCLVFKSPKAVALKSSALKSQLWFAQVDASNTTVWAQFKGVNPNDQLVEINVRKTVFYPEKPGMNYLTVRGFALRHAATPWAPPTAEQVGLIGTHWSKGWIIENNVVSHSTCSGIALGKYGDEWDNTSANTAEGYVKTIERALQNRWNKESIGHHIVRNNTISHCEQAGIVGSLGAAFCTVTGNTIHDIHVRRLFTGAEMAGIKFHAAIDTVIANNHIYRTCLGLWLDWMAQGTRVSRNLFHDNAGQDLFVEVDHGPFLVDNNLFLSAVSLLDMSEGGAYAHNLFSGKIISRPEPNRETPFHPAHSTALAGLTKILGGDDRFYNNIFIGQGASAASTGKGAPGFGLCVYDARELPLQTGGNVYYNGARPHAKETNALTLAGIDPKAEIVATGDGVDLRLQLGPELKQAATARVTTDLLGKAKIPNLSYENPDGSPLVVDKDYFGRPRDETKPTAGPFEVPVSGRLKF
ncbi:MAG: carbohydrate-binding protein [Verrucomicrobia bacterium]|nr:carbohydrate-binding protein [Verrucomicrobiota bacterium]